MTVRTGADGQPICDEFACRTWGCWCSRSPDPVCEHGNHPRDCPSCPAPVPFRPYVDRGIRPPDTDPRTNGASGHDVTLRTCRAAAPEPIKRGGMVPMGSPPPPPVKLTEPPPPPPIPYKEKR